MTNIIDLIKKKINKKKDLFQRWYDLEGKDDVDKKINEATQLAFNDSLDAVDDAVRELGSDYETFTKSVRREILIQQRDKMDEEIKEIEKELPAEMLAFENPFRVPFYQKSIRDKNILTHEEFGLVYSDGSGCSFVMIDEINDMIEAGILKVDYDKLEKYIFENRVTSFTKEEEE